MVKRDKALEEIESSISYIDSDNLYQAIIDIKRVLYSIHAYMEGLKK